MPQGDKKTLLGVVVNGPIRILIGMKLMFHLHIQIKPLDK